MKIYGTVGKLIDRYGTEVTVDNEKTKAFIQPIRYNSRYYGTTKRKVSGTVTYGKIFVYRQARNKTDLRQKRNTNRRP